MSIEYANNVSDTLVGCIDRITNTVRLGVDKFIKSEGKKETTNESTGVTGHPQHVQ